VTAHEPTPRNSTAPTNGDTGGGTDGGDLTELIDILSDFTGSFAEDMTDALFGVFWQPFLDVLHAAVDFVIVLLSWMPSTTYPEILAVHRDVFLIATGLASIGFVVTGIAFIGYGPAGLSYRRLRPVIPKLLAALVFGGLAPWLLQPVVDLSEAAALAFAPRNPDTTAMLMLGGELVVVAFVQAVVLLALLAVLGMTKIFVAFGVAAAPLIAVLWAVPFRYTQGKADTLIGAWWAALLVGPFDMIVFKLTLALLSFDGFDAASWILGLAGPLLLIGLPYLLFSAGISAAAPAMAASRGVTRRATEIEVSDETKQRLGRMAGDVRRDVTRLYRRSRPVRTRENPYLTRNILDRSGGDDNE